jgi:hypothetical protein
MNEVARLVDHSQVVYPIENKDDVIKNANGYLLGQLINYDGLTPK